MGINTNMLMVTIYYLSWSVLIVNLTRLQSPATRILLEMLLLRYFVGVFKAHNQLTLSNRDDPRKICEGLHQSVKGLKSRAESSLKKKKSDCGQ